MPDVALTSISANPVAALSGVPGVGQGAMSQRFRRGLQQALRDGLTAPPIQITLSYNLFSPEQMQLLSRLKVWRASLGATLALDPSLLWPTASLERLAKDPDSLNIEITSANIRRWQRDQFASSLNSYLKSNM
jgi:hypothetical protein